MSFFTPVVNPDVYVTLRHALFLRPLRYARAQRLVLVFVFVVRRIFREPTASSTTVVCERWPGARERRVTRRDATRRNITQHDAVQRALAVCLLSTVVLEELPLRHENYFRFVRDPGDIYKERVGVADRAPRDRSLLCERRELQDDLGVERRREYHTFLL